jgi:hypothetical protein
MTAARIPTFLLGAVLLLAAGGAADAQRQPDPPPPRGRAAADSGGLAPAEILNMLDAYAIVQAQQTLRLEDRQYGEFVTRLKHLQQTRRRNLQARTAILQELRRLTGPQAGPIDEPVVRERLQALRDHDRRTADELLKAYEGLDQVLDVRQQARFRLFEELLERRKIDLLKRAQQGAARQRRQ